MEVPENKHIERRKKPGADILVVDDTRENLRLLVRMLAEQGFKVRPTALPMAAARLSIFFIRASGWKGLPFSMPMAFSWPANSTS